MDIELGLEKIKRLLMLLGNPGRFLKVIHVAGTNGKGSVIAYLNSILLEKGLKVGRYISPAVFDELEIIQINGINISQAEYNAYMEEIEAIAFNMQQKPSLFEMQTALALLYFYRNNCNVCIIETGLGGSLDATNVFLKVLCSVITSVDYDHTAYLGDTIEQIASAKAGIIKNYCPVVLAPQKHEEVYEVVKQKVETVYATLHCVNVKNTVLGLEQESFVKYQRENILTAVEVIKVLNAYEYEISEQNIINGIKKAYWPGRFEKISEEPIVYIDGAHNPNGARALKEAVGAVVQGKKLVFVAGILADKDYKEISRIMAPLAEKIYTFTPENDRGLSAEILKSEMARYNENVIACDSVQEALGLATKDREKAIVVFGSLSHLKAVKGYFLNEDRK